jgi:hypothetical protein
LIGTNGKRLQHVARRALAFSDPEPSGPFWTKIIPAKVAGDEDNPLVLRGMVDRPPDKTREQWLAQRARELGTSTLTVTAAGVANERDRG